MLKYWVFLAIAIVCEVFATSALKASEEFTKLIPSLVVITGYGFAFYFLSLSIKVIPVGVAYAIWAGIGIVLITITSWIVFGQKLDLPAICGLGLIVSGVMVINLFSKVSGA
ncbi:MAG: multidrug efflux SMR transporter [Desulforegulaceae bacterium]|nr:multidrug efflux SMR transporter [Desulforegulaceae bacterium]